MNIEFTGAHMETLCELKALAEKHGCRITFGVDSWAHNDPVFGDFKNYTDGIYSELSSNGDFSNGSYDITKLWFQLYDPNNEKQKYHCLSYSEGSQIVEYEKYGWEELSEKAQDFLEENEAEWSEGSIDEKITLYAEFGGTTIKGFDGLGHPNVYREGMALKFFGDLVCDYLKEERIVRTY